MTLMLARTQWTGEEWLGDRIENRKNAIGPSSSPAANLSLHGGSTLFLTNYWVMSSDYFIA